MLSPEVQFAITAVVKQEQALAAARATAAAKHDRAVGPDKVAERGKQTKAARKKAQERAAEAASAAA